MNICPSAVRKVTEAAVAPWPINLHALKTPITLKNSSAANRCSQEQWHQIIYITLAGAISLLQRLWISDSMILSFTADYDIIYIWLV